MGCLFGCGKIVGRRGDDSEDRGRRHDHVVDERAVDLDGVHHVPAAQPAQPVEAAVGRRATGTQSGRGTDRADRDQRGDDAEEEPEVAEMPR